MIQKQTVYLRVENYLERQWKESFENIVDAKEGYFFTPEELNEYTANVIKQTLETASEEATIYRSETDERYDGVNQESITNTFEESYKKFEV